MTCLATYRNRKTGEIDHTTVEDDLEADKVLVVLCEQDEYWTLLKVKEL